MLDDLIEFGIIFGGFVLICVGIGVVCSAPIIGLSYYSSCREAEVFNQINHTAWTCGDFFWAGDQINAKTQTINLK